MRDWTAFKRSFTAEQEAALWQYFIDHTQVMPNGYFSVQFYVHDVDDFWRRVYARYTGDFIRYSQQDKKTKQLKYETLMAELHIHRRLSKQMSDVSDYIDQDGTILQKIVLLIHRRTRGQLRKLNVGDNPTA